MGCNKYERAFEKGSNFSRFIDEPMFLDDQPFNLIRKLVYN